MIFGDSGMTSLPRRSWYDPASTTKGPKRYDATIVIVRLRAGGGRPQHTPRRLLLPHCTDRGGGGLIFSIPIVFFFERDRRDDIPFEDIVDIVRVLNKAEHCVFEVQARVVYQVYEELGIA